ncbi:hypothetical protein SF23_20390 [Streptomyces sp. MBRL 10]|nr:hypothetical protein SF23_20390 [Streptomyces sp. MBRL 10]
MNNRTGCSDAGPGTQAVPYCTIAAAAAVVAPGQTVRVVSGIPYKEGLTVNRSGEPGKPITFMADGPANATWRLGPDKDLVVDGASHVVIRGLSTDGAARVTRSSHVELDRISVARDSDSLVVGAGAEDVRVSRSTLYGVRVEGGAARTVVSHNVIYGDQDAAVAAVDAPGTVVTNNSVYLNCVAAVSLAGGSAGSALFNNVISDLAPTKCTTPGRRVGLSVASSATPGTRADHNLIAGTGRADHVAYDWAGTAHADRDAFHAATGQVPGTSSSPPPPRSPRSPSTRPTRPRRACSPPTRGATRSSTTCACPTPARTAGTSTGAPARARTGWRASRPNWISLGAGRHPGEGDRHGGQRLGRPPHLHLRLR